MRRLIASSGYRRATPEGRAAYWKTLHDIFKTEAKDALKAIVWADPSLFDASRYGKPEGTSGALRETLKAGKAFAAEVNRTRGNPLDAAFAIKWR